MLTWDPLKFDIVIGPHKVVGTAPDNFITASFPQPYRGEAGMGKDAT